MKLLFLGAGSAFTFGTDNFQSNLLLVSEQGDKLLLDCGSDIRFSLYKAGFSYLDVTDIYVSHLHADHVGGLEYIGLIQKFDPRCDRPNLYLSKELAGDLWQRTLSGGMRAIEDDIAELDTYFKVHPVEHNGYFEWQGVQFNLIKVIHVENPYLPMPSYGLFFELLGTKVFITTDTQLRLEVIGKYYEEADLIFHDCETSRFPSTVHAHYNQLATLPERIKRKMWLYGYQPGLLPDAQRDGFLGFVSRGQTFEFSNAASTPQEAMMAGHPELA